MYSSLGKPTNIFWQECPVGKADRQKLLNQKGCVVWITGLSGSGKSTLACTLGRELHNRGKLSYILDGDNLRHGLNKDLGFKAEDRTENIRRVGEVAKLFADAGLICMASLISPYRKDRDFCRSISSDASFIEVFMNMPLELCEERDPKGLYKLARAGKIKDRDTTREWSLSLSMYNGRASCHLLRGEGLFARVARAKLNSLLSQYRVTKSLFPTCL